MSLNANHGFYEIKQNEWIYLLEETGDGDEECSKSYWDWHENAIAYGYFSSLISAVSHLEKNHANPGTSGEICEFGRFEITDELAEAIKRGVKS